MPKCRGCGAQLEPTVSVCPYCDTQYPFSSSEPTSAVGPAAEPKTDSKSLIAKGPAESGLGRQMKTFSCKSCGAKVSYDPNLKAMACAYCGSTYVIEEQAENVAERPGRVIPFSFDEDHARKLFKQWLGKGFFRPRDLTRESKIKKIRGVYMPFWAFDADADSSWTADAGYFYYRREPYTTKDSQGNTVTEYRNVRHTRWQPANGTHSAHYEDHLVSASAGLDQQWLRKILPFKMDQALVYKSDYLAGFAAENPSIEAEPAQRTAIAELNDREIRGCDLLVPGDTHRSLHVNTRFSNWRYDLVLLPLWIAAYRYKEKVYRFLVNGQTGEVRGKAPFSWLKLIVLILLGLGAVALGVVLYTIVMHPQV